MTMLDFFDLNLSKTEQWVHALIFVANLLLLFFSKPIIKRIDPTEDHPVTLRIFIAINVLFLLFHLVDLLLVALNFDYQNVFIKLAYTALTFYLSLLFFKIAKVFFRRKFGKAKKFEDELVYQDSYSSRLVEIIFLVTLFLFATYILIKIWNMDSLLEATGIFGIAIGFAALTSNVWAPDILSGLIILNTNILEDGDVVVIDGYRDEYIIHKVSFIYTVLYDIRNNHRTFIRNKKFIESKIDNLSRVASTDGIRKCLRYNIAYPDMSFSTKEERLQHLQDFKKKIDKLFRGAYEIAKERNDILLKPEKMFDWYLTNTGDYALEYSLFIYIEPIPTTKITAIARKYVLSTAFGINDIVLEAATAVGLELKTPDLVELNPGSTPASPLIDTTSQRSGV